MKNVGLKKEKFSRIKQEYHDIDYVNKLNPEEKEFLSTFMEEDLGARFNHPKKRLYKEKKDELLSYRRHNARERDTYSRAKAAGKLMFEDPLRYMEVNQTVDSGKNDTEDQMIDYLDAVRESEDW